jgi:hypothetical protein
VNDHRGGRDELVMSERVARGLCEEVERGISSIRGGGADGNSRLAENASGSPR